MASCFKTIFCTKSCKNCVFALRFMRISWDIEQNSIDKSLHVAFYFTYYRESYKKKKQQAQIKPISYVAQQMKIIDFFG